LITSDRFRRTDYLANLEAVRPSLPDLELVVMLSSAGGALPADVVPYDRMIASDPLAALPAVDPDRPAVIAYTSGTTADPKGVMHTHRTFLAELRQLCAIQFSAHRPMLVGAPIGHAIGMLGGLLMPLYRGLPIHLTDVWDAGAVLDAMEEADLSAGSGATVFLLSLLDHPRFSPSHVARMPSIGLGGAPVPQAVAERAEDLGIHITRAYGSSEHPSTTGSSPDAPRAKRNATDGKALAGVELRIVDEEGRDLPAGTAGEIWSRGPDLCAGYTNPDLTREAFRPDGWYASGDIGVLDADGYLTITDRKKDIIIRGGANISAAEIEELVMRLPSVAEVAVVAAPDPRLGERAFAFLRLRPGAVAPDLATLQSHLETCGLAKPKWPEQLRIVEDFPRTASGKIKKFTLRDALRAEAKSER
jgi:acyl-CoA synthetase (AMP-forming)/AMP-acid ligase II